MRLRDLFRGPSSHERKTIVSSSISSFVPVFDVNASANLSQDKDTDTLHKYLLADQADHSAKSPPLHIAVESANLRTIQTLLQAGVQINLTDSSFSTPLHIAAQMGNEEIVQMLLSHGANMYKQDGTGRNPFHIAIATGNIRVIEQFISANDTRQNIVHTADNQHWTPLMCACANNHAAVCALLLSHNADLCAINDRGMTAFHIVAFLGSLPVLQELLTSSSNDEASLKAINQGDNRNQTPLFYACMEGHLDVALTLLRAGANAYHLDNDQQTCLHAMLSSSIILKRHIRLFYGVIQYVDFRSYQDYLGRTLLDLACLNKLKTLIYLLGLLNYKSNSDTLFHNEPIENDILHSNKRILSLRHICVLHFKRSTISHRYAQPITQHDLLKSALQQTFQIESHKDSTNIEENKLLDDVAPLLLPLSITPQQSNKSHKNSKSTKTLDKKMRKTTTISAANKWSRQSDLQQPQSTWSTWTNRIKGQRLPPAIPSAQQIFTSGEETISLQLPRSISSLKNLAFELLNNPSKIDNLLDFPSLKNDHLLDEDLTMSMNKYHLLGPD